MRHLKKFHNVNEAETSSKSISAEDWKKIGPNDRDGDTPKGFVESCDKMISKIEAERAADREKEN